MSWLGNSIVSWGKVAAGIASLNLVFVFALCSPSMSQEAIV